MIASPIPNNTLDSVIICFVSRYAPIPMSVNPKAIPMSTFPTGHTISNMSHKKNNAPRKSKIPPTLASGRSEKKSCNQIENTEGSWFESSSGILDVVLDEILAPNLANSGLIDVLFLVDTGVSGETSELIAVDSVSSLVTSHVELVFMIVSTTGGIFVQKVLSINAFEKKKNLIKVPKIAHQKIIENHSSKNE